MAGHPEATANGLALDRPPEAGDDSGIDFVMAGRNRAARTDPETRPSTSLPLKTDSALGDFTRKLLAPAAAGGFFCGRQGERTDGIGAGHLDSGGGPDRGRDLVFQGQEQTFGLARRARAFFLVRRPPLGYIPRHDRRAFALRITAPRRGG